MNSKKMISTAAAVLVFGGSLITATPALAQTNTTPGNNNFFSGLIQFISKTFNLNQTQVQSAIQQYQQQNPRPQRQGNASGRGRMNMEQMEEKRLANLVTQGKITDAQKQAILTELAAIKTKYNPQNMQNMTADQRKHQMQAMQDELKAWATSQGIDPSYVLFGGRGMGGPGMRGGIGPGRWRPKPSGSPDASPAS